MASNKTMFDELEERLPSWQDVPKVDWLLSISDIHVDFPANLHWINQLPACPNTALIVAGDVTHHLEELGAVLRLLVG